MEFPQRFGKYDLLDRIATGGMAEVFLARQVGIGGFERRLVIKRIRPELASDPHLGRLFIQEARIGVQLNHPNVVQVYELGRVGASLYIAMEWLRGSDLTRFVKVLRAEDGRLPTPLAVHIVAEACRGLAHAHTRLDQDGQALGLVHQDVSPHNILVTFDGDVKLVDFGIARAMNSATDSTRHGGGKVAYMSPEQARGEEVDHRADLFSAGIVLWELLANRRLYKHADPDVKLAMVRTASIADPRAHGAAMDDALWLILTRALAPVAGDRYPSAHAFEEDLRAWLFERRSRVGPKQLAALLRTALQDDGLVPVARPLVERVAADVARLDATASTATPISGRNTGTLPGNLSTSRGERRAVATLLLDFDGITDLSARLEPEPLFRRHLRLLRWVRSVVDRWGGVLQQAVDDQVTVLFGVPRAHGDEIARALDCALELRTSISSLRNRGLTLEVAIGVHIGDVTIGYVGHRIRYVARGDTTRFARRLSALADIGQILVSSQVFEAAESVFVLRRGPDVPCRGERTGLPSYRVTERRRGVAGSTRGTWIRRADELDAVRALLGTLADGKGASLTVHGDAGTGRSRLLRELHDIAVRRGLPCAIARCTPWGGRPALAPLADLILDVLNIDPSAGRDPNRLADSLAGWGSPRRDADVVSALSGVIPALTPDAAETVRVVARLLTVRAQHGAFIVALDDVHHLPVDALACLRATVEAVAQCPIAWLWTTRDLVSVPEKKAPVAHLPALSNEQVGRLVTTLLDADAVEDIIVNRIRRLAEGNPRYVEELTRFMVSEGAVRVENRVAMAVEARTTLPLPPSLAALQASRIDALDAPCRGVLQLAAIAGATFEEELVRDAAGLDDIAIPLRELSARGLIIRSPDPGTWSFASDLVRETGLRGILGVQRGDYHRLVAAAIERKHPGDPGAWTEEFARHLAAGGRRVDGARAAFSCGERYEKSQDLLRARLWYQTGLDWIAAKPPSADEWDAHVQGETTLRIRLGSVLMMLGDTVSGERQLRLALELAGDSGLPWLELRAHLEMARAYEQRHKLKLASAHIGQATALLAVEKDPVLEREVLETAARLAFDAGSSSEAEALWKKALVLAAGNPAAESACEVGLASLYLRSGDLDEASTLLHRGLQSARLGRDRILEGRILNNLGLLAADRGEFEAALNMFRDAIQIREGIGYLRGIAVNHHNLGDVYLRMHQNSRAHVAFERSREIATTMGWTQGIALNEVYLGYLMQGTTEDAVAAIDLAAAIARTLGDTELSHVGGWLAGRRLADAGQAERARERWQAVLDEEALYEGKTALATTVRTALEALPANPR